MNKIKIGIIGGGGYTAGELIRILINHPKVEITTVTSTTFSNKKVNSVHQDLLDFELVYTEKLSGEEEVVFLCLGHGVSGNFLKENPIPESVKVIDLSNDFRLTPDNTFENRTFVYGLPELNKKQIQLAQNIANPGCFATAIQLAVLPLAKENLIKNHIHVSAITGATGAGQKQSVTTHFPWRNNNISVYKTFTHQHLGEINQSIQQLQPETHSEVFFVPYRGDFARGIFASVYTPFSGTQEEVNQLYKTFYKDAEFTKISDKPIHMKQVVNTNFCVIYIEVKNGQILITSAIDNLTKGASGQAVQNLNLMMNWEENLGLNLKANYF